MNKKPENDPIQSVGGKQVREGVLVDRENLQRMLVVQAARVGHEVGRVCALDDAVMPWDQAGDVAQQLAVWSVLTVLHSQQVTMAQLHSLWVAYLERDNWVLGPLNYDAKTHPDLLPFDHLTPRIVDNKKLVFAAIRACLNLPVDFVEEVEDGE